MIYNLVGNAFKFTPQHGTVAVLVETTAAGELTMKVKDTGPGIKEEAMQHIFDAYYQTPEGQKQEMGSGIGLALTKELSTLMNGHISVESTYGKGTIFTVIIPLIAAEPGAEPVLLLDDPGYEEVVVPPVPAAGQARRTILLVEDHPDMMWYLESILKTDYQILTAENGVEALKILRESTRAIAGIISDVMMPQMDGFELLSHLRKDEKLLHIPVIMLTARADKEDRLNALLGGIDDYITKPFDSVELKIRLKTLIDRKQSTAQQSLEEKQADEPTEVTTYDLKWIAQVEEILHREIRNTQFSMPMLADELSMSERNLRYKIKKITSLSPNQYFREIKLKKAQALFDAGLYDTVSQVAHQVGFESHKHFTKLYTQRFGKLPSTYLRQSAVTA